MNALYNESYERVVLGILLIDNTLIDIISGRLIKECFYSAKNRYLYEKICEQWQEKKLVNILSLSTSFSNISAASLAELTSETPSASNWEFYVTELLNLYTARRMKTEVGQLLTNISGSNTSETISQFNSKLANYMSIGGNQASNAQQLIERLGDQMQDAFNRKVELLGYSCGFGNLDSVLDGFQTKQLYVIGARPSIGKTAYALSLLMGFAKQNIQCSVFSLEMNDEQLFYRMVASESKVPASHLRKGLFMHSKDAMMRVQNAFRRMYQFPINIFDKDIDNDNILYSKIRYEAKINGSKVIFIDHLGLIESSNSTGQRYVDVGRITKTLHKMAKELDVCIILLCQCGREAEGKEPNLSLLRESGNIEQDADVIMFLHRERDTTDKMIPTKVIVAKNRDGKIGTVNFLFQPDFAKFVMDNGSRNDEVGTAPDLRRSPYEQRSNNSSSWNDNDKF